MHTITIREAEQSSTTYVRKVPYWKSILMDSALSSNLLQRILAASYPNVFVAIFNRFLLKSQELALRPTVQSGMTFQTARAKSESARFYFSHFVSKSMEPSTR